MTSEEACPVYSVSELTDWLEKFKYLWGAVFIAIGIFLCIWGKKIFSGSVYIISVLGIVTLMMLLFYNKIFAHNTKGWVIWVYLAGSILIGLGTGFIFYKSQKISAALIAAWGGFMLGLLINASFEWVDRSSVAYWVINSLCATIATVLAFFLFDHVVIISTSLSGAYLFIRGISLYTGNFPREWEIY
jgi:hypothetical protein